MNQIQESVEKLSDRVIDQNSAVEQTSAAIIQMSASIDSVARIAQDKRSVTDDLSDLTQDGGEKILSTNSIIQNISTHVDSMMEIINVINSITSQTELLSMNTAIEAAHAGDYGKGFSVVADEIRKLAENTSDNAKMITVSLNQVLQQIKNALESSNLSAEVFEKISNHINLFIDAFEEITNSTAEVSAGSGEILEAVKSLSFASQSIKTGTEEIKAGTSEINDSLGIIKKNSSDNIEAVRYVDMLTDNIQNVLSENLIISKWNNENADNLNKLIDTFKIDSDKYDDEIDFSEIIISHHKWLSNLENYISTNIGVQNKNY